MDMNIIINTLKQEIAPALGCTEPIAVALAAAAAKNAVGGELLSIQVGVSPNIYKNGMNVGIPGTDKVGLYISAALGAVAGKPEYKLEVLKDVNEDYNTIANKLVADKKVKIDIEREEGNFYICCKVTTDKGTGKAVIRNKHTNIVLVEANGEVKYENSTEEDAVQFEADKLKKFTLPQIIKEIQNIDSEKLKFLLDGVKMNYDVAYEGLNNEYGMQIGRTIKKSIEKGLLGDDIYQNAVMMTAAAVDARMAGCFMPVMSSAGSGDHGITVIIPIAVAAEKLKVTEDKLLKALAIGHITNIYIKQFTGRLSSMCGCCISAAVGTGIGVCYLLGGNEKELEYTVNNMVGDTSGVICDGAKAGCSIKISTAVGAAIKAALLAMNGIRVPSDNGIVGDSMDESIRNLGRISLETLYQTDTSVLGVMVEKNMK